MTPSETHQLLRAVTALLVRPVEGKLLVLHLVAGVEGAGELHRGAIHGIDGGRGHDLHARSRGCCQMQMNLGGATGSHEPMSPFRPALGPGIAFKAHPHTLHAARTGISLPSSPSPGTIPWLDKKRLVPAVAGLVTLLCQP